MRCAALESILESDEPMLYQTHLADTLGVEHHAIVTAAPCLNLLANTSPFCPHLCVAGGVWVIPASDGKPCSAWMLFSTVTCIALG